jgi:methionyl-tRNA synthetase
LLYPIIPDSSKKVLNTINIDDKHIKLSSIKSQNLFDYNMELKSLKILFTKVENDN